MAWRKKLLNLLADVLRFAARGILLIGLIALALTFVYVLIKSCWYGKEYLDATLFSEPWFHGR